MGIIPPEFSDSQIGLEEPPVSLSQEPEAQAVILLICPNCGGKDSAVNTANNACVATCPMCQCKFDGQGGGGPPRGALSIGTGFEPADQMESGFERILCKVFEKQVRHMNSVTMRSASQQQLKLPGR
jgi:hypothetical protein